MKLKRASIVTKLIVFALIVYASASLVNLMTTINAAKAKQAELREKITAMEVSNAALEYGIEHSDDDEVKADIAREMGYIYPDERILYDSVG
ncbi:MAG: hypothetical protein LBJ84_03925 [Oscillospiraceae bacterium]|jgi:cell division protein FtsB|nr:hypothetical protein [Oscillospiraceae bacterium]